MPAEISPDLTVALFVIGHVLLGGLFVIGGARHFPVLPAITEAVRAHGVPLPRLTLMVGSLFQILCGVLLMLGAFVALVALGLVLFTVLASLMLLNFWDQEAMHAKPRSRARRPTPRSRAAC